MLTIRLVYVNFSSDALSAFFGLYIVCRIFEMWNKTLSHFSATQDCITNHRAGIRELFQLVVPFQILQFMVTVWASNKSFNSYLYL